MVGYKILGEGHQGVILYPCLPNKHISDANKYVSKIGSESSMKREYENYTLLPDVLNDKLYLKEAYFEGLGPRDLELLQQLGIKKKYTHQITMKYFEGKTVTEILQNNLLSRKTSMSNGELYWFLDSALLCYGYIEEMNAHKLFHNDMTTENLMYDKKNRKLILIDFGFLTSIEPKHYPARMFANAKGEYSEKIKNTLDIVDKTAYVSDKKSMRNVIKDIVMNMAFGRKILNDYDIEHMEGFDENFSSNNFENRAKILFDLGIIKTKDNRVDNLNNVDEIDIASIDIIKEKLPQIRDAFYKSKSAKSLSLSKTSRKSRKPNSYSRSKSQKAKSI